MYIELQSLRVAFQDGTMNISFQESGKLSSLIKNLDSIVQNDIVEINEDYHEVYAKTIRDFIAKIRIIKNESNVSSTSIEDAERLCLAVIGIICKYSYISIFNKNMRIIKEYETKIRDDIAHYTLSRTDERFNKIANRLSPES